MIWDISLEKRLRHLDRTFDIRFNCRSNAHKLVLFGPSGAGKTQTLKMIAGLVHADSGHCKIVGETFFDSSADVDFSPQQRRLAYVFQDYALFPHLTVRQNLAFGLRKGWRNPSRHKTDAAVDQWLKAFQLQAHAGHFPYQLSGGQKQRTALARALVTEPRALLLDEPFAALDNLLRQRLRDELAELQHRLQIPMLLITHDEDDVRYLGDEVLYMHAGQMAASTDAALAAL